MIEFKNGRRITIVEYNSCRRKWKRWRQKQVSLVIKQILVQLDLYIRSDKNLIYKYVESLCELSKKIKLFDKTLNSYPTTYLLLNNKL